MEIVTTIKGKVVEEEVGRTSYSFPDTDGYVRLEPGKRNLLHPSLAVFDDVDCDFLFETRLKIMYISYQKDENGEYEKALLTTSMDYVMDLADELIGEQ